MLRQEAQIPVRPIRAILPAHYGVGYQIIRSYVHTFIRSYVYEDWKCAGFELERHVLPMVVD